MNLVGAPFAVGVPLFDGPEGEALIFSDSDVNRENQEARRVGRKQLYSKQGRVNLVRCT
jgi:hypothetical protein